MRTSFLWLAFFENLDDPLRAASVDLPRKLSALAARDRIAQTNLAGIRRWAINLLSPDRTLKLGSKGKRRRADWDQQYLLTVLNQSLN